MKLAKRLSRLGTETAFEVLVKAKALEAQGKEIVHLEIGEPDFPTPQSVVAAGTHALHQGHTHYCASAGMPELREAVAREVRASRGIPVNADWVVVTPGAKPIMFYLILALVEEGDEVLYPNPGFPIYESMINFAGGKPVPLPLLERFEFRFDVNELRQRVSDRTKLIIINSPQNPTGGLLTKSDLEAVAEIAVERDIMVLSDEIYARIIYDGTHHSISSLPGMIERTVILDGFSKTYAMTGWRLGYGIMRPDLQAHIAKLVTNSVSCTAPFTQLAGIEALASAESDVSQMVAEFRQRRDYVSQALDSIPGMRCLCPPGAFYVFPNIRSFGMASSAFSDYLLNSAGVAVLSGSSFGEYGEGHIRISYANSMANLTKAVERIGEAVRRLGR
ncbi:MAG: pyridoxal phosphate-dependent aminotransferase [Acidimicrobiia bacterium]|nr:pyridoxal phosphate-dependent aminotransferase [Acidimicrobiia bacterium]